MPSVVRSYCKINLGLAIGPPRPDGFHSLSTLYQTLALHDFLTVSARPALTTQIHITSNDPRVPRDQRNTVWKIVQLALEHMGRTANVNIRIEKKLPIQGGMGAGSANAAAALLALERELAVQLSEAVRLKIAAEVGSDVPMFLLGGSVLGSDRGQVVAGLPDVTLGGSREIACVIALPKTGVSTPQAFRDWDALVESNSPRDLHSSEKSDTLRKLSRTYASVFGDYAFGLHSVRNVAGTSGILPELSSGADLNGPEKQHGRSSEQHHTPPSTDTSSSEIDVAENSLLALTHFGIENDFEKVVFCQNPLLGEIKRHLVGGKQGNGAVYAALSGSGSAMFGLYRSTADAGAAQQRLQENHVQAMVTSTLPRHLYWSNMFAE